MKWKQLLDRQLRERIDLVAIEAKAGKTMAEAASSLGVSKQQLYQIAKRERILFSKTYEYQRNFKKD
tara:strand:- start:1525 stop:1725 length:201 start_codon:yes stop_codon:yes gene_type:complete